MRKLPSIISAGAAPCLGPCGRRKKRDATGDNGSSPKQTLLHVCFVFLQSSPSHIPFPPPARKAEEVRVHTPPPGSPLPPVLLCLSHPMHKACIPTFWQLAHEKGAGERERNLTRAGTQGLLTRLCPRRSHPRPTPGCPRHRRPSCPRRPRPSAWTGSSRPACGARPGSLGRAGSGCRGRALSAPCPRRCRRWRRCWLGRQRGL
jgi:hypothetical protein